MPKSRNNRKSKTAQKRKDKKQQNDSLKSKEMENMVGIPIATSLLDKMVDGIEYESLLKYKAVNINIASEIKRAIAEIQDIRNKTLICYVANNINPRIKSSISIDNTDDLPFGEMINTIPADIKDIDILIVTPGGSAQQVAKFVDRLRPRFDNVSFIIPNTAMSAGTIFVMSGNEFIMDARSYIGPIDPQIPNKDGLYVPAQSILTLINEIQERGQKNIEQGKNPQWSDLQLLRQIDAKDIGNAMNASQYSIDLVYYYLYNYKFKNWNIHSDTGLPVSDAEKQARAKEIAQLLCSHSHWKSHGRGINREDVWNKCKLKVTHAESIDGLERAIRRFWALFYWLFENSPCYKVFISSEYAVFRNEVPLSIQEKV